MVMPATAGVMSVGTAATIVAVMTMISAADAVFFVRAAYFLLAFNVRAVIGVEKTTAIHGVGVMYLVC